ncbi:ubiquinol-cytochrome C reductase complex subunit oxen [Ptiloglossa arizonensis]|uniref:ubiquinol-cytochrome C reductase complex subunit oxen n=1 Tax=Ptiloglossa arizonensis TaxID=3350558 RepID=UPI003F9F6551
MAGIASTAYKLIFKRTSTFALAILASTFFFERGINVVADSIFDNANKGKLWKDIQHKYQ